MYDKRSLLWQMIVTVTLLFTVFAFTGCSKKSSDDAPPPSQVAQANTSLESQDVAAAKNHYAEALAADPTNKEANVGYALTEGILLVEDPAIMAIIDKWEIYTPTVQNVLYDAVTNGFEVWGGNALYCGTAPGRNGYTKLTTTSAASPYTFNGAYTYYIVYTPPFSEITLDAADPTSGNAISGNYPVCSSTGNPDIGTAGDGKTTKLGGPDMGGSNWTVQANPGSTSVTVATSGTSQTAVPALFAKAFGKKAPSQAGDTSALSNAIGLLAKLPKNKPSLIQKAKAAFFAPLATAPTISEMQAVLDSSVIPVLTDMITKLRVVEGTGYTFVITPAMTGGTETVNTIIGDGELYAIDTVISGLKALLNIITAYNFDVDYDIINADPLSAVNPPSGGLTSSVDATTFFTLKAGGGAKMAAALTGLQEAADKAKLCYTTVYTAWGYTGTTNLIPTQNFTDNRLRWDDPVYPADFTVIKDTENRNVLDALKMALQGQVTYTNTVASNIETETLSNGVTTLTLSTGPTNTVDSVDTLDFNATMFFTNPVDRTDLPLLSYDLPIDGALSLQYDEPVNSETSPGIPVYSNIVQDPEPDPTFNGIFPNGYPKN